MKVRTLKEVLREQCLPELKARCAYFDVATLRAWLDGRKVAWIAPTLNRYMVELAESGFVWSAGRGWYSFLAEPVQLDTAPLAEITKDLRERFPLLDFACWSTQQLNSYMHHMLGKFVTFVLVPPDALGSVFDALREHGGSVYLNPTRKEVAKTFQMDSETIVLRKLNALHTPVKNRMLAPEGVLVDLSLEADKLVLMDKAEFRQIAARLVTSGRIDFASLVAYARLRKVVVSDLFQDVESIIYSV